MFPRRRRLLLEWLEDRAAPARVAPERDIVPLAPPAFDRAIDFTCSFLDALTPLARKPEPPSQSMFVNDFLIELTPDRGTELIALRSQAGNGYPRLIAA